MTGWIQPGAAIAVYRKTREGSRDLQHLKVARVAQKSFTVEGIDDRFGLASLQTKGTGGTWYTANYVATRPGSPDALRVADGDNRRRVWAKVFPYLHNDSESLDKVDQAIRELTEWRALLASEDKT